MAPTVEAKTLSVENTKPSKSTVEKATTSPDQEPVFDPNYTVLTPEVLELKIKAHADRTDFNGYKIPTHDELTYPDITLSSAALKAAAYHMGQYCLKECREFMLCKHEERDTRMCLAEGRVVTRCGLEFFHALKNVCYQEFEDHWRCLHHSGRHMDFKNCRANQKVFDNCVQEKMGIERPYVGYYATAHVHDTDRPKPKRYRRLFEDPTKGMPKEYAAPPAWRGNRSYIGI